MLHFPNPSPLYNFRVLTKENIEHVASLYARYFKKPWGEDFFKNILESRGGVGIGAFDHDVRLIGFCLSRWVFDEAEIFTLVVELTKRNQGIASVLLSRLIEELRLKGVTKVYLEVHEKNQSALSLYQKLYFQPVGIRQRYYLDTEETPGNAIVLELVLNK